WPWVMTHQDEMPSKMRVPSAASSQAPSARAIFVMTGCSACCVKGCQMGDGWPDLIDSASARVPQSLPCVRPCRAQIRYKTIIAPSAQPHVRAAGGETFFGWSGGGISCVRLALLRRPAAKAPLIIHAIERAFAKIARSQNLAHKDDGCALDGKFLHSSGNRFKRAAHDALVRPAGAEDDHRRAIRAVEGDKARSHVRQHMHREMDGKGCVRGREGFERFGFRHGRRPPR